MSLQLHRLAARHFPDVARRATGPDGGGWRPAVPRRAAAYTPWLKESRSLTARILRALPQAAGFAVKVLRHGPGRPDADEYALLDLPTRSLACTRDVVLRADGRALVYAHSVVPPAWRHHPWTAWDKVGSRALGTVLFVEPGIIAGPLTFRALDARHPLYRRAAAWHQAEDGPLPAQLWARRALFWRHGAPLLVTEVFLPAILALGAT